MTHTVSLTVTAEGAEDVAKLLKALNIAGLEVETLFSTPGKKSVEEIHQKHQKQREMLKRNMSNFNKTDKPKTRTKRKKWLTKTAKRKLRKLANEGKNMKEASDITGIPYMNIFQWQRNPKSKVTFVKGKKGRKGVR